MKFARQLHSNIRLIIVIGITLVIIAGMVVSLVLIQQSQDLRQDAAGGDIQVPSCSLPTTATDIIVRFPRNPDLYLNAREGKTNSINAESIQGPHGSTIPPGSYRITLQSYDNHDNTIPSPDSIHYQTKEEWFVKLYANSNNLVAQSGTIGDLPDKQQYKSQQVNDSLQINEVVTRVVAHHAHVPDEKPQSVYPICSVFSPLSAPTPTDPPASPTQTLSPSATQIQTPLPSSTPTAIPPTPTRIISMTPTATVTNAAIPTATSSPQPSASPTALASVTPTQIPPNPTATLQASPLPTLVPSATPIQLAGKACIGDFVGMDQNGDGIIQSGDVGLPQAGVQLYLGDAAEPAYSTTTDANGHYAFCDLNAGSYRVRFLLPSGYIFSPIAQGSDPTLDSNAHLDSGFSDTITLSSGVSIHDIDALVISTQNTSQNQSIAQAPVVSPTPITLPQAGNLSPTLLITLSGLLLLLAGMMFILL